MKMENSENFRSPKKSSSPYLSFELIKTILAPIGRSKQFFEKMSASKTSKGGGGRRGRVFKGLLIVLESGHQY